MDGTDVRELDESTEQEVQPENNAEVAGSESVDFEQELDGASLMEQFLSDPSHDYKTLKYGDVLEGIIMHLDRDELLVDIGSKAEGIVPAKEYSSLSTEEKGKLQVGDNILVFVVQPENQEGHPVVSIDRARQEKSWRRLQEIHEANDVIEAEVTNYNKGGLLVNLDGVRGFVPASQVSEIRGGDESSKQADMARLIGTSMPLKVIEINRHRNRLILSERQAIQERRDIMKEKLIEELKEGEIRKGRVSSICDFGAFVDIGGADGLVHLSELSWSRVRHPSELLKLGEEVDVYVLGINPTEKKIALSIKRTQAEPWSRVASSYEVGQLVRGTVTQLANFGAFARIEDGIEGLIHVSELADERIQHPKQVVHEGQDLLLRIIRIDPQRRRMGLSLRRALDTPDAELVTAFGEDVLPERDALVATIRESLDAEGLTGTTQEEPEPAPVAATASTETEPAPVPQVDPIAAFEERQQRAEEAAARSSRASRQQNRQQQGNEGRTSFGSGDMSAMALAFAQAGGAEELLAAAEEQAAQPKAKADTAEAVTEEAAAAEATVDETPATETPEVEAVAVETPEAESVADEAPAPEAPAVESPEAEATAVEAPETEAPAVESAGDQENSAPKGKELGPAEGKGTAWVEGTGENDVPAGFPIKGNASSRIYHTEDSPSYERTVAEVYFATPEDAEAAGYRLPKSMQQAGEAVANAVADLADAATKDDA
jgi:small subunit ribosomal protein S1